MRPPCDMQAYRYIWYRCALWIALLATAMGESVTAVGTDADLAPPRHASMRSWCKGRPKAGNEAATETVADGLRCDGDGYKCEIIVQGG